MGVDGAGSGRAGGGWKGGARDYARFGERSLDDGFFNGRQIVPADWVENCRRAERDAFKPLYGERFAAFPEAGYSRQWWVLDGKTGRHAALGVFGQMIYIDPPSQVVAVTTFS